MSHGQAYEVNVRWEDTGQLVQLVEIREHYWQVMEQREQVLVEVRWWFEGQEHWLVEGFREKVLAVSQRVQVVREGH